MAVKKRYVVIGSFWVIIVMINALAWNSMPFCDWYISHIFPIWVESYGRLTGLFSFSVGEIMLVIFASLILILLLTGIYAAVYKLVCAIKRKKKKLPLWVRFYGFGMLVLFTCVGIIMTLNCFILFHGSTFSEKYMEKAEDKQYRLSELEELRNVVVSECNRLSKLVERDEYGNVVYNGDMKAQAIKEMQRLGEIYPQLSGFYPPPKGFYFSGFFSQQKMMGYYFPFSMEANYNTQMYITNTPGTLCHELAHLKGFIYEDEANFIGFLACVDSEDIFFQYSGYLSVLYYLDNDYYDAIEENKTIYSQQIPISKQVRKDKVFLTPEAWARVEEKAVLSTETVSRASNAFVEANLNLNGIADGLVSYSRVVELLLEYYDIGSEE